MLPRGSPFLELLNKLILWHSIGHVILTAMDLTHDIIELLAFQCPLFLISVLLPVWVELDLMEAQLSDALAMVLV